VTHRWMTTSLLCALAAPLTACGAKDDDNAAAPSPARPAVAAPSRLDRHALALALGNGVRARLDQLAVMQQPPDGASDLGQDLPAGLLRDVACAPSAVSTGADVRTWRCRVRWETIAGAGKTTNYSVRSFATGCFAAQAMPQLPQVKDPTIASFSEHPLNAVVSTRKGC
jgi:hypothetical protein